jgi:type I restriction enzyme M protein
MFWSALNDTGRAGFVMANSAADARGAELEIRQKLIETGTVDCIVSVGPNFLYTVTLPCTLWFFDKSKAKTKRKDEVLFIDARHVFRQIDRAHLDFTPQQIEFLANIVRLWRGEQKSQWRRDRLGEPISIKHGFAFKSELFDQQGAFVVTNPGNSYQEGGFKLADEKRRGYS